MNKKAKETIVEAYKNGSYYAPGTVEVVVCNGHRLTLEYPNPEEYESSDLRAENLMNVVEMFSSIFWPGIPYSTFSKIVDALAEGRPYNGRKMKMQIFWN